MSFVRGQERFVYQAVFERLQQGLLTGLDWAGTTLGTALVPLYPYGATWPLAFQEQSLDPKLAPIVPNTIAISEGRIPDDVDLELGAESPGGLTSTTHTFFIDVYGESQSIARCIASDVRTLLTARLPGASRYLTLPDYLAAGAPALAGHLMHFTDVEVDFPAVGSAAKLHWVVVKVTVEHEWSV